MKKRHIIPTTMLILAGAALQAREHLVASFAYIYPSEPQNSSQTDLTHDSFGRETKVSSRRPDASAPIYTATLEYTDITPGHYSTCLVKLSDQPQGTPSSTKYTRKYDNQMRVIEESEEYSADGSNYRLTNLFDYSDYPQGANIEWSQYIISPSSGEPIELLNRRAVAYCEGARRYIEFYENARQKFEVFNDHTESTSFDNDGNITEINYTYYADGQRIGQKSAQPIAGSNPIAYSWYGDLKTTVIDNTSGTRVETTSNADPETGEWLPSSINEYSSNWDEINFKGEKKHKTYSNWNNAEKKWGRIQTVTYSWISSKMQKIQTDIDAPGDPFATPSTTYRFYIADTNSTLPAKMVSDNLFYTTENDLEANVTYYTWYDKQGNQKRKIRADHRYYFFDEFREFHSGQWIIPTQTFSIYIKNDYLQYYIDPSTGCTRSATNILKDGTKWATTLFTIEGSRVKEYETSYNHNHETTERAKFKYIGDNTISCTYTERNSTSATYSEYDMLHRLLHYFNYDEAAGSYIRSSTHSQRTGQYTLNDTTVTIKTTSYGSSEEHPAIIKTKRLQYADRDEQLEIYYDYDYATADYVLTKKVRSGKTPAPEWLTFKTPGVLNFDNPLYPSTSFRYTTSGFVPMHALTQPKQQSYDSWSETSMPDENGELALTYKSYYEYEITDRLNCRRNITTHDGETYISETRYELNADGYITRFAQYDNEIQFRYNADGLLVRAIYPDHESRWAYDTPSDLLSVQSIEADRHHLPYTVNGTTITTPDASPMTLYTLDGRILAQTINGNTINAAPGIYLLHINGQTYKIALHD